MTKCDKCGDESSRAFYHLDGAWLCVYCRLGAANARVAELEGAFQQMTMDWKAGSETIHELRLQLADERNARRWIPVGERLPEAYGLYLIAREWPDGGYIIESAFYHPSVKAFAGCPDAKAWRPARFDKLETGEMKVASQWSPGLTMEILRAISALWDHPMRPHILHTMGIEERARFIAMGCTVKAALDAEDQKLLRTIIDVQTMTRREQVCKELGLLLKDGKIVGTVDEVIVPPPGCDRGTTVNMNMPEGMGITRRVDTTLPPGTIEVWQDGVRVGRITGIGKSIPSIGERP